jgi:thiol-disulfide isomerase/thioredoxin
MKPFNGSPLVAAALAAGLLSLALPHAARAQETGLPIGSTAPNAVVQTLDGKPVNLSSVVKGPALVEFWATWCENCEALLPTLQKAYATYGKQMNFVGVSVSVNQSPKRVQLHVAKYKVPGVQVYDAKGDATTGWDVPATSYVVVLDRNGKVVYTGLGGDQDLEAAILKGLGR